ncbi:hypothetical protein D0T84_15890 [Dysgonomonas sp. 521]|nr:hypothetical protein [Dysgonomonas sp. 521]
MCDGTSQMEISPKPCTDVEADGTGCDDEFEITDPDCVNGPFTFAVLTGADYLSLTETDETAGTFRVSFEANNSTKPRSAVVRVTSSCTGLYKDFLFSQLGQSCDSSLGEAPAINSKPSGKTISFCAGGAVYLWVDPAFANLDELIWTRNNIEIARGVNYITVTQAGVYDIWMGLIGCGQKAGNAVTVSKDGTGAPAPVAIVVRGNNGMVCDANGTTKLIASNPSGTGTVVWFKDGQDSGLTGTEIQAGVGDWFAVVKDGDCYSTPSETVTVSVDPNAGTDLITPVIAKPAVFCAGGSVQLSVSNVQPGYTYTWYENNTQIGTGQNILYTVPATGSSFVLRCRATMSSSCAAEAIGTETITTGTIPQRPNITGDKVLCSGVATLNAVPSGAGTYTYQWYKDGQPYATTKNITVSTGGEYSVTVTETGGCTSPAATITLSNESSAVPTVTLNRSAEEPNKGDVVTYTAEINFGPATAYKWTVTGDATIQSGGGNTSFAVVKFSATGTAATVKVEVSNACGTGIGQHVVTMKDDCVSPTSVSPSADSKQTTFVNTEVTLGKVSASFASGAPTVSYQWYRSTDGGAIYTKLSGETSNSCIVKEPAAGTYKYYCEVGNGSGCTGSTPMNSGVYTVDVVKSMAIGTGTFSGKMCFDIAFSNDRENGCAPVTSRTPQKTDFSKNNPVTDTQDPASGITAPYTGVQVYTFKPAANVSNVRFLYIDPSGQVIDDMQPNADYSGNFTSSSECKATVTYKSSLNEDLKGKTQKTPLKAELYVVFNNKSNNTGTDVMLKLEVRLQDCACCGAATVDGGWLTFMCHNLGVDPSLDPFTPNAALIGNYYQWGQNDTNWVSGRKGSAKAWGDGTANLNQSKGSKDPCPPGWKIPSQKQWGAIFRGGTTNGAPSAATANTWTKVGTFVLNSASGYMVGGSLFLPNGGNRQSASKYDHIGTYGNYWSSTFISSTYAYSLQSGSTMITTGQNIAEHIHARAIRCVLDE